MLGINNSDTNIYNNLAAEEHVLREYSDDVFMLWRADSSVVLGKHQNAMAEINYPFIRQNNINVARRMTGGGTVYHDLGNLNFSFILTGEKGKMVDFGRFVTPIKDFLADLGIEAEIGKRNDITINGLKVSGNAEHVFKTRVLHHGTLLVHSDLTVLEQAIKVKPDRYKDKAVQSKRSMVTNISDHLSQPITISSFTDRLFTCLSKIFNASGHKFSANELEKISRLAHSKYAQWDWIYGYSPRYSLSNAAHINGSSIEINFEVEKGLLSSLVVLENGKEYFPELCKKIIGTKHAYDDILEKLIKFKHVFSPNYEWIDLFF